MIDIEARLRKTFSALAGNESMAAGLPEEAAAELLRWGEEIAEAQVRQTGDMEDEAAEEFLAPGLSALRKFLRAAGNWAAEKDETVRADWWTRVEKNAKTLFGEEVRLPSASDLPPEADAGQILLFLKNFIAEQRGSPNAT